MAHALIFGASVISGWALVNQARVYPSSTAFSRITGLSNRPYPTLQQAQLPVDERVQIYSGIDITLSADEVVSQLKSTVPGVDTVTHVFFTAYVQAADLESLKAINTHMIDVAIRAVERLASNLRSVILQTGGKGYGVEYPDKIEIKTPFKESHPRIAEPWASKVFYYSQYDTLQQLSAGKTWTFTDIRPDAIIGFAPGSNAMNLARGIGLYLALQRKVHGPGAKVPFPGSARGYTAMHTNTSQDILSKLEIFAALNPEKCGDGQAFNVVDGLPTTWSEYWPRLCEHFGLIGAGPVDDLETVGEFVSKHREQWRDLARRQGLREDVVDEQQWDFVNFMLVQLGFDRQYDRSRSREVGFLEEVDTLNGYITAWDRMRAAHILPPLA